MNNHGNYIISLGNLCRWLAQQAEALGVEIYPGFAAAEVLYRRGRPRQGVATGDMGIGKDGQPQGRLHARRRAARASRRSSPKAAAARSTKTLIERFKLRDGVRARRPTASASRSCGRSIRRSISPASSSTRVGWPLDAQTYGGSFLYHLENNQVAVGFVVGLDYAEPASLPLRGVPALQDPSGDPPDSRGRPAHLLWRARAQRGRPPVDPEAGLPRRRADRLRRRLPQRAAGSRAATPR